MADMQQIKTPIRQNDPLALTPPGRDARCQFC
jgi:hypothetical protein